MTDKRVQIRCQWGFGALQFESTGEIIKGERCDELAVYSVRDDRGKAKALCEKHVDFLRQLNLFDPRTDRPE